MTATTRSAPVLAFTQGDPAGVGPELLLKLLADPLERPYEPLLIAERAALEAVRSTALGDEAPSDLWERLVFFDRPPATGELGDGCVAVVDPVGAARRVEPGKPGAADAEAALAALDAGIELVQSGVADALVTAPVSKASIARHVRPDFRGHTDYLARAAGLERYGRDYMMAFLAPELRVALLSTHVSLREAIATIDRRSVLDALLCLARHATGRIGLAGLNPHAGEGGMMGREEEEILAPAVAQARLRSLDVRGPESPDSLFARAIAGEFDWVLALYHDQGLIAVKTAAFGKATNWTVGLPFIRTSVDHGTAFDIAGRGTADDGSLRAVVRSTLELIDSRPERASASESGSGR